MSDLDRQPRCPKCGRFTSGHAGMDQGSNEVWYWSCACGAWGEDGHG